MKWFKNFKYWVIRNWYILFRKSECMKVTMSTGTPEKGEAYLMDNEKKIVHMGKNWYRLLMLLDMRPFNTIQVLKVYSLLFAWTAFIIFLIIREMICSCLYLIAHEAMVFVMVFIFVVVWTAMMYKKQEKKNLIYEDEKE